MASSGNSSTAFKRIFSALFPFADFFYILQQEEYSSARFLKWLPRFFFRRGFQQRDWLKYTPRVRSSLAFTVALWLASCDAAVSAVAHQVPSIPILSAVFAIAAVVVAWLLAIPCFVLAGNWMLSPYYDFLKRRIVRRTVAMVARQKGLKVVAVAGSFGKTTTRHFIYQLVRYHYATQMPPGNINTPLGIAAWVSAHLKPGTQLLLLEMDAYCRGEIAQSAAIAPADIAVITNVGDQHLERFGSRTELALTLRELFDGAKPDAVRLCTEETRQILSLPAGCSTVPPADLHTLLDAATRAAFSSSNLINLAFAVRIAEQLGVPKDFIVDTCRTMELPERRQREGEWHGYVAIDDSYNISLTTARAGLDAAAALAKREGKKLLVVTAGIPELGCCEQDGNGKLGALIAAKADRAAILQSIFASEIEKGMGDDRKYAVFRDLASLLAAAHGQFPPEQWVVLVQPELTDLYY